MDQEVRAFANARNAEHILVQEVERLGSLRLSKLSAGDKIRHATTLELLAEQLGHIIKLLEMRQEGDAAKAIEPDFVTMGKEPRTRIAGDLSAYLGEEG